MRTINMRARSILARPGETAPVTGRSQTSAGPHSGRAREAGRARSRWRGPFLAPLIVVLLVTTIVPMVYTVLLSLDSSNKQLYPPEPQSAHNYDRLIHDDAFWQSVWLTIQFLVASLIIEIVVGVFAALLIYNLIPKTRAITAVLLWPVVLAPIAVALIFKFELQGGIGIFSYYLDKLGYQQAWLSKPHEAMAVLVGVDAWQFMPFVILLALAALQGFPADIHEASVLDGATIVQRVRYVVLPSIAPAIITIALLRFIDAIQLFPTIFVLTSGGPGSSTQMLSYYAFTTFFNQFQFGYGAALAICVVVFTALCVIILVRWQRNVERSSGI